MDLDMHGLLPQALQIVHNVCTIIKTMPVKEPQSKHMMDRFIAIYGGLTGVGQDQNFVDGTAIDATRKAFPDLYDLQGLLQVLRKGEALLLDCKDFLLKMFHGNEALVSEREDLIVLTDAQFATFQKINEDLDMHKSRFDFESYCDGFAKDSETVSGYMAKRSEPEKMRNVSVSDCLRIDPSDIIIGAQIGSGAFAKVFEATWSGCRCAVKRFKAGCMSIDYIPKLQKELDFLVQLRHPYMVQLMGLSIDSEHRCSILMERMQCSLRDLIDARLRTGEKVPFDISEASLIIKKIAQGMRFMHSREVVHRDLKAANVMVNKHPFNIDVKIADFGESQILDPNKNFGIAGTTAWMAPEILSARLRPSLGELASQTRNVSLEAADVYSFAMTCFEVLTGEKPFSGTLSPKQFGDVISGLLRPKLPRKCHYEFKDFLDGCWNSDAMKRPNFETICYILDDPTMSRLDQLNLTKAKTHVMFMESENDSHSVPLSIPAYLKIKFFSQHVNINNRLARGSNRVNKSEVYRATWLGCDFAVKRLWFSYDGTSNRLKHLSAVQREIDFLIKLRHPHIVQLVGISLHPGVPLSGCSIVMEIMSSNLDVLIEKRLSWTQFKRSVLVKIGPLDLHEAVIIVRKMP